MFFHLGSNRQIGSGVVGPMPGDTLDRYTADWPPEEAQLFQIVMRTMDRAYIKNSQPGGDVPESDNPARDAFRAVMR